MPSCYIFCSAFDFNITCDLNYRTIMRSMAAATCRSMPITILRRHIILGIVALGYTAAAGGVS